MKLRYHTRDYGCTGEAFGVWESEINGLCFTWPVPEADEMARYYNMPAYLSHNSEQRGLFAALYRRVRTHMHGRKLKLIRAYVKLRSAKVLDFGCGSGHFAAYLQASRPGWQVAGVEPHAAAAAHAREAHQLSVYPALSELPDGEHERLSLITAWHALEHVHDPRETLLQMNQRLVHHGKLILALPNYLSYDAQVYGQHWAGLDTPRHLFHFSPAGITKLAAACGFSLEEKQGMPFDAFYVSLLSEKYAGHGFTGPLRAGITALLSNIYAVSNVNRSSSVMYVFTKTSALS